jgi:hypothetical protein
VVTRRRLLVLLLHRLLLVLTLTAYSYCGPAETETRTQPYPPGHLRQDIRLFFAPTLLLGGTRRQPKNRARRRFALGARRPGSRAAGGAQQHKPIKSATPNQSIWRLVAWKLNNLPGPHSAIAIPITAFYHTLTCSGSARKIADRRRHFTL